MPPSETEPLLDSRIDQSEPRPSSTPDDPELQAGGFARNLGTPEAFAIIISIVIGSGIFTSPGSVDANVPSPGIALVVWLVGGVLAWTGACTFAELGTAIEGEGGVQPYLTHCFGEIFGFLAGWTWITSVMPATLAILSIIFVEIIFSAFGVDSAPSTAAAGQGSFKTVVIHKLLSILVLCLTSLANSIGTDASTKLNKLFVTVKFLAISVVVAAGLAVVVVVSASGRDNIGGTDWHTHSWFTPRSHTINPDGSLTEWPSLSLWAILGHCCTALYGALWGYSGWDKAIYVSSELSQPSRQLPLAFNTAIPVIIICFILANASYCVLLPWGGISVTDSIAVDAISRLLGHGFGIASAVLICLVVAGSLLGNSFVAGRMAVAAANKGWLPRAFGILGRIGVSDSSPPTPPLEQPTDGSKDPEREQQSQSTASQSDAPMNALLLSTVLSTLYILLGNFRALLVFNGLGEYSFFFLTTLGAILLRYTQPQLPRPYKANLAIPIIFAVVSGFIVARGAAFEPTIALVYKQNAFEGRFDTWKLAACVPPRSSLTTSNPASSSLTPSGLTPAFFPTSLPSTHSAPSSVSHNSKIPTLQFLALWFHCGIQTTKPERFPSSERTESHYQNIPAMDFATIKRRATDLVQSLPHPSLPSRPAAPAYPTMKGTWEKIDIPPLPRTSHSVDVVSGSAYVFGGEIKPREPVDNDMHVIKLPYSGAGADYYTVKAKAAKVVALSEEPPKEGKGKEKEQLKAPEPEVQSKSRSEDEGSSDEDSDEEEEDEDSSDDDDDSDEDSDEDSEDSDEEKPKKKSTPKDKGKAVAVEGPVKTDVPSSRVGHATAVIGTRIFMFGGRGGPGMSPLDEGGRVWVFETKSECWSYLDPKEGALVPPPRSYHAAAATEKPRDFFGNDPSSPGKPNATWMDWAKGDSDRVGIPQDPVVGVVTEEATDEEDLGFGTFLIHGGCLPGEGRRTNDLWAFDVMSKTWQELPSAPGSARGGTAICISKNRLYRFGGFNGETQEGGQLDVIELGVSTFQDARTPAPGEVIVSARGPWHSVYPAPQSASEGNDTTPFPPPRSVASLSSITIGGGREYLVLMLGESDASAQGHAGAGKFYDDVWAFQVPPLGMSTASVGDAFRAAFGGKPNEGKWFPVEAGAYDSDDEDQEEDIGPGARGWFASAAMLDVEENGVFIWGGLDEKNTRLGDGYIFRLE
ncbi:hypothetical protein MKZ38_005179 [Zalerion maritima]|uniref:Uncharacterized protein n=1 Tax=Zalerion maritima TaxID=339359 RepID=A0AAD5WWP7_9PEZI|nr:hypothetical protein MKZ38_005179 [Zalerion maritima]